MVVKGICGLNFHSPLKGLDVNSVRTLAGLSDVVGSLHPHKRIHFDAKRFSIRSAISPERSALPLSKLESAGLETRRTVAAAVTDRPAGSMISVRTKSPGWGGFFIGMVVLLLLSLVIIFQV
jgi:hypothetical protein